ncbi:MAG: type IVB secretion system protein IcmJDotN [Alphaproteobacteria bacterium]
MKIPLILGVTKNAAKAKKIDNVLKQKILERDEQTCQCCGFKSQKYQEVLHKNGNPADFREENLATACIFCYQCFHIDRVSEMKSGALIWMPEIEQAELHHMARAIYVARISQGPVAEAARKALEIVMARREEVKERISTDDPYILATVLRDYLSRKSYDARGKKLDGVRLFPLDRRIIKEADLEFNQFPQILAYWRSKDGPFGGKAPPQWISIYQDLIAKAA